MGPPLKGTENTPDWSRLVPTSAISVHHSLANLSSAELPRPNSFISLLPKGGRRSDYPYFKLLGSWAATDDGTKISRASPPPQEDLPESQPTLGSCTMWKLLHNFRVTPGFYLPCLGLSTETPVNVLSRACNPGTGVISEDVGTSAVGHYLCRGKFHGAFGKPSNLRKEFHNKEESWGCPENLALFDRLLSTSQGHLRVK